MRAVCVTTHDPFHPYKGMEQLVIETPVPLWKLAPKTDKPFVCLRNGEPVLRRYWDETVEDADVITFYTLPLGGGGDSNPLRILLMIVVAWAAPFVAGYLNMSIGLQGFAFEVFAGAVGLVGSMLVSALFPAPRMPTPNQAAALASASPTYSLQGQGNAARIGASIPSQYGRVKCYPDFGAQPYTEYVGNEQYLYQLFVIGQGHYDIEAVQIEDTDISSWEEVAYEVVAPSGTLTLFPSNVTTSLEVSGQELAGRRSATYSQSGTTITVTLADHALAPGAKLYLDFTSGTAIDGRYSVVNATGGTFTVTATDSTTTSGNCNVDVYVGPFIVNAPDTEANALAIDIVCPRGLYSVNQSTGAIESATVKFVAEYREIDDDGMPIGTWQQWTEETITASTTTPQRFSFRHGVAPSRYEVQARRTNAKSSVSTVGDDLAWTGLRAYLPETTDFGDITLLAVRMKASNNLSMQASRKIAVTSTRKLYTWETGTGWSANPTASQSIAWAIADMLKNANYGRGLPDSRIDLDGLVALGQEWASRNDKFNFRFDNTLTLWEALTQAAACGRAKPFIQGGIVRVVRDSAQSTPVALFSMRNIIKGSFSVEFLTPTEDTADCVEVTYFSDVAWVPRTVTSALPGSLKQVPAKISLLGITDRDQAHREGIYYAAANFYRRTVIRFSTEMEGFIPSIGDLIAVQHDMPQWGQASDCTHQISIMNLVPRSEDFGYWAWADAYVAKWPLTTPDGGTSCDRIVEHDTTAEHGMGRTDVTVNSGTSYTFSIWVKDYSGDRSVMIRPGNVAAFGSQAFVVIRPDTGEVLAVGDDVLGYVVEDDGDGWFHVSVTAQADGNAAIGMVVVLCGPTITSISPTYTGNYSSGVWLWGAQLITTHSSKGYDWRRPYVKTETVPVTRATALVEDQFDWSIPSPHYVAVKRRDGSVQGPYEVEWASKHGVSFVSASPDMFVTEEYERTVFVFGSANTWSQMAKVISIKPRGLTQVDIEAVNEDPSVHTADQGVTAPPIVSSQLPTVYTAPVIEGLVSKSSVDNPNLALLSWRPAAGADYYIIEASVDDEHWTRVTETRAANFIGQAIYGSATIFRVCGVGLTKGPWVKNYYGLYSDYMWYQDSVLMWDADQNTLMWR
jgi:hypothetical protein